MDFVRIEEIRVNATPKQVFGLIGDIRRHPEWAYNDLTVEHIGGPQVGKGAVYRSVVNGAMPGSKKPVSGTIKVIESHAPELFVYECEDDAGRYRWMFECSIWDDVTVVTHTCERLEAASRFVTLAQPTAWRMFGAKQVRGGLAAIKELAERPPITLPEPRASTETARTIELPSEPVSGR